MPIQTAHYTIRHLRRHEIEQLLQLCKAEGRHMGTAAEVQSWMQIDPRGFFVAANQEGQIIGSCCGMRLSAVHGYVGMYVVDKAYRGLGIGKQVWDAALDHLGGRNAGLSAVAHLFTLYRDKAGFSKVADWTVDLYRLESLATALPHCAHHQQLAMGQQTVHKLKQGQKHLNLHSHHQHPQHQAPTSPPTQHQLRRKKAKKTAAVAASLAITSEETVESVVPSRKYHSGSLLEYSIAQEVVVLLDDNEAEEVNSTTAQEQQQKTPIFADLASTFVSNEECNNFFCLLQQYQQKQKQKSKYLRASSKASSNSIEQQVSDDESYGFSSLFFEQQHNKAAAAGGDEDDSGEEVVEVLEEERAEEGVEARGTGFAEDVLEIVAEEEQTENSSLSNNSNDEISDLEEEKEVVDVLPLNDSTAEEVIIPGKKFVKKKKQTTCCSTTVLHRPQYSGKLRTEPVDSSSADAQLLIEGILAYDRGLHAYDRTRIVRLTLGEEHCLARAALLGSSVVGYGAIKLNLQNMWIVSPLYADSDYIARLLLLDLLADLAFYRAAKLHQSGPQCRRSEQQQQSPMLTGDSVVLKVPSSNRHAAAMLEALGFSKQEYSLRRCYTQRLEEVPTQAIYALHTSVFCTE